MNNFVVVRLNFQFASGGECSVDVIGENIVLNYPGSFFDSLLSNRWSQNSNLVVPSDIYETPMNELKFRKNIVPLLLNEKINPVKSIKLEPFIDYFFASATTLSKDIIFNHIKRFATFTSVKEIAPVLNWLQDNCYYQFIEQTLSKWVSFLDPLRDIFVSEKLLMKYLMLSTMASVQTNLTKIINPFEIISQISSSVSLPPLLVKNSLLDNESINFVKSLEQFKQNMTKMCPFLNHIDWNDGICVAGGSVISCLTNDIYQTHDVDLFVYSNEISFRKLVKEIDAFIFHRRKSYTCMNDNGVVTILIEGCSFSFQIININKQSPNDVIKSFDADINQCFYDGSKVLCSESCLFSLMTKTIHLLSTVKKYRIYRFLEKGFSLSSILNYRAHLELKLSHHCRFNPNCDCCFHADEIMEMLSKYQGVSDRIKKHQLIQYSNKNEWLHIAAYNDLLNFFGASKVYETIYLLLQNFEYTTLSSSDYDDDKVKCNYISCDFHSIDSDELMLTPNNQSRNFSIVDKQNRDLIIFLNNVEVQSINKDAGSTQSFGVVLDEDSPLAVKMKLIESAIHSLANSVYPLKSKLTNNTLYFKVNPSTYIQNIKIGSKINALLHMNSFYDFALHSYVRYDAISLHLLF